MEQLVTRFLLNTLAVWVIIHFLYYRKSRRSDYYFTFSLISISIFFLIFLLGSVKIKIGFALGLFAIFSIIRYRTESMPVREMTYLFVIIVLSVINALSETLTYAEMLFTNLMFVTAIWALENNRWLNYTPYKLVTYDKIELICPDRRGELTADLARRLGLDILRVEVGTVDFLHDTALLKVYYHPTEESRSTIDTVMKLEKGGEL